MARPRMCFTLLYSDGNFHLSRNFNLQSVGNFEWLMENYEFESIARSIDELVILNVSRGPIDWNDFVKTIQSLVRHCFMPVAVGGGVRDQKHARLLFENGADKIVLNSAFFTDPEFIRELVQSYGSQSIVASLDFKRMGDDCSARIFIDSGRQEAGMSLTDAVLKVVELGAGEMYLTSIDRDGTGMGYDLEAVELAYRSCDLPIIAAGGADTYDRLAEGLKSGLASAVSASHLFNFMCDGLKDARQQLIAEGIDLSQWHFEDLKRC